MQLTLNCVTQGANNCCPMCLVYRMGFLTVRLSILASYYTCQRLLYLNGLLLRFSESARYSATALRVVNQSRPFLTASIFPVRHSSARCDVLSPL